MIRSIIVGLFAAGAAAGCANMQPVLTGGYYCQVGTQLGCPGHEGSGDCQPCPTTTATPVRSASAAATPAALAERPD
jgi:hypothetical protein